MMGSCASYVAEWKFSFFPLKGKGTRSSVDMRAKERTAVNCEIPKSP
jgi:hypothetical protein